VNTIAKNSKKAFYYGKGPAAWKCTRNWNFIKARAALKKSISLTTVPFL